MIKMRHLDKEEAYPFFLAAVNRKKAGCAKDNLLRISPTVEECYRQYAQLFDENQLQNLSPSEACRAYKADLLGLYSSQSLVTKNFRKKFSALNPQSYSGLCPYCAINDASTTEHILSKEIFPEYAINVLNLIPCCSDCNTFKGVRYTNQEGERMVLNFYTDDLFHEQFLFMRITSHNGMPFMEYYLAQTHSMTDSQFAIIERHFKTLNLVGGTELGRYDKRAIQNFSDLALEYQEQQFRSDEEYRLFASRQLERCEKMALTKGVNHWQVVMRKAFATSDVFKDYIMSMNPVVS